MAEANRTDGPEEWCRAWLGARPVSPISTVVGHVDWYTGNLRWQDGRLHAVHDWTARRPCRKHYLRPGHERFAISGERSVQADLGLSEAFLAGYEKARGRPWTREERQLCWAAAVWRQTYELSSSTGNIPARLALSQSELDDRLRPAGLA